MEEMCKSSYAAQAKKNKGHKRKSGSKNLIACLSVAMLARKRISRVLRMPGVQLQAAEGERGLTCQRDEVCKVVPASCGKEKQNNQNTTQAIKNTSGSWTPLRWALHQEAMLATSSMHQEKHISHASAKAHQPCVRKRTSHASGKAHQPCIRNSTSVMHQETHISHASGNAHQPCIWKSTSAMHQEKHNSHASGKAQQPCISKSTTAMRQQKHISHASGKAHQPCVSKSTSASSDPGSEPHKPRRKKAN
eukprot:1115712-Pelagomonas_calceolata.AAC.5